jgi:preprotein translocase subunit SecG
MYTFFIILVVLAAILLTLLVLVQNSKGGGLAAGFSSTNQVMGVRKTTDFLEKATWTLVVALVVFSIAAVGFRADRGDAIQSEIQQFYQEAQTQFPTTTNPGFGEQGSDADDNGMQ